MYVTAFNTSSGPVTVDAEGRQIGAGDWGTANTTRELASDAMTAGTLVVVEVPDDGNPEAVAARDRTRQIADRFAALDGLEKDHLAEVAADVGVHESITHKRDLVHALAARLDVEVPAPPAAEATTDETPGEPVLPEPVEPATPESPPDGPVTPETPGDAPVKQTSRRRAGRE